MKFTEHMTWGSGCVWKGIMKLLNILVTDISGSGKTRTEVQKCGWLSSRRAFFYGYDEGYDCLILNKDRGFDELEGQIREDSIIVDYHGYEFFLEHWIHTVFVLRSSGIV